VTPAELSAAISGCLAAAVAAGELSVDLPTDLRLDRPKQREHGDWSTNLALQLAKRPPKNRVEFYRPQGDARFGLSGSA